MHMPTHPATVDATIPRPVLDFHVHPIEVHDQRPWSRELYERLAPDISARIAEFEDPAVLRAHLLADGVDEAVVLGEVVPLASGTVTNERICTYARQGNDLEGAVWLHPFVSLNPGVHHDPGRELDSLRARWRVAGVKLTPPYQHFMPADPRLYPLYARCQEIGLPVLFHTGLSTFRGSRLKYADPLLVDDVAVDFPRLRIVLAHSGRGVWYREAALMARLHEHVYLELAGLPPRNLRAYFPDLDHLADKIIFGSDWPVLPDLRANVAALARIFGPRATDVLYRTGRGLLTA